MHKIIYQKNLSWNHQERFSIEAFETFQEETSNSASLQGGSFIVIFMAARVFLQLFSINFNKTEEKSCNRLKKENSFNDLQEGKQNYV